MGLFSRDSGDSATAADQRPRRSSFNHAALDRADIEDAQRGHPAVSLQQFAAANGLGYTNNELHPAFLSNLPKWPDYVFNVCHGTFPGGRLGLLQHELLELETDDGGIRGGGTFHSVRVVTRHSAKAVFGLGTDEPAQAPFTGNSAWLPITSIHLRTPELNQLPTFAIRDLGGGALFGGGTLDQYGLPGFRLDRGPKDNPAAMSAIGAACAPALSTRRDAYVRLQVRYGVLSLTVNGYRADEPDLHHLAATAAHLADSLVALTRRAPDGAFAVGGPAAASMATADWYPKPHPNYVPAYAAAAGKLGLVHEHQSHVASIAPRCPIPGAASGVLFGTLPGTTTVGRMVWFELGGRFSGSVRAGVMVPAAAGASTPLGGVFHAPTGMQVEVVDGIAHCWQVALLTGRLESAQLTPAARAAFAATGAATI